MDARYLSQQIPLSEYPWMTQSQWSFTGHPWILDIYHSRPLVRVSMDDTVTIAICKSMDAGYPSQHHSIHG